MGIPVIVMGRSGTGKSTSLRNFSSDDVGIINILGKPLPFRNNLKTVSTRNYDEIRNLLSRCKADSYVIDDAGYLITDMFMARHSDAGKGNSVYSLYNDIGDCFYNLIRFISTDLPQKRIVYLMMHEDTDDNGLIKPKTIGKLLDEKVCVEGLVSVLLRSVCVGGEYLFLTNGDGIQKSPMDMFDKTEIPNDLKLVDEAIREYWSLNG